MLSRPALRIWILAATGVFFFVVLFTFYSDSVGSPLDYAHAKALEYCDSSTSKGAARNCEDPYRRPGYLYIPHNKEDYKNTTWIPYTNDYLNAEAPDYAAYPPTHELVFNETAIEPSFLDAPGNPQQWMRMATLENERRHKAVSDIEKPVVDDFIGMKDDASLGWLWGRRVLMFSDSVDRYMTQFLCEEFGSEIYFPIRDKSGRYSKGICEIPAFNLTLVYLHSPGSFTYKPDWWWIENMITVAWEERWDTLWKPHEAPIQGPKGRPDLILWQNGLWDQRAFWEGGAAMHDKEEKPMALKKRQMVWEEVRFVTARIKKIAKRLNDEFGADAPIMFRSLTVHRESGMGDAIMFEMDRLGRAVAEQAGQEVFEWARVITLLGTLYRDDLHPGKGPASWLWGNMVLEYLARSAGAQTGGEDRSPYFDGWDACHPELSGWGGR